MSADFQAAVERLTARRSEVLWTAGPQRIERTAVDRFREAIGWPEATGDDVPPTMLGHLFRLGLDIHRDERPKETLDDALISPVNGGTEFELVRTPEIGDAICAQAVLKDVYFREGKSGPLAFVVTETSFTDQNDRLVAAFRVTMIYRDVA